MSGGSFDYVCMADLLNHQGDVAAMAAELETYPESPGRDAALADTKRVLACMDEINVLQHKLYDVWHAVEWELSGDTIREGTLAVLGDYKP